MRATVTRDRFTTLSTGGTLDLDGTFQNYTLEPPKRLNKPCCIPAALYQCKLMWSDKFQRVTPHVLDVPGFTAIEWHRGNYPNDTLACTLVGLTRGTDCVWQSDAAFVALMAKLPPAFEVEYVDVAGLTVEA